MLYPYLSADESWDKLNDVLDLSGIHEPIQQLAKYVLQGRLQHVFDIVNEIKCKDSETSVDKNMVFMKALYQHIQFMAGYVTRKMENFTELMPSEKLLTAFYQCIADVIAHPRQKFSIDMFKQRFGVSVEETGLFMFEKIGHDIFHSQRTTAY